MPTQRFYIANVLSAIIWAPVLIFAGDLLAHSLGPENLATKILLITVLIAALALLAPSVLRRLTTR
jgi:membrane protein DedA with SNARE-associated domain